MYSLLKARLTEKEKNELVNLNRIYDVAETIGIIEAFDTVINGLDKEQMGLYSDEIVVLLGLRANFEFETKKAVENSVRVAK